MTSDHTPAPPILVSPESLKAETLQAVIESYVLREGTDYGVSEISLEKKIDNLRNKIDREEIVLVFDPDSESLNFLTQNEWSRFKSNL